MGLLKAKVSFMVDGRVISQGDLYDDADPIVAARPSLFAPPDVKVSGDVRTTATIDGPVTAPPPFVPTRPSANASADEWRAYVTSVEPVSDVDGLKRAGLIELADALEAGEVEIAEGA